MEVSIKSSLKPRTHTVQSGWSRVRERFFQQDCFRFAVSICFRMTSHLACSQCQQICSLHIWLFFLYALAEKSQWQVEPCVQCTVIGRQHKQILSAAAYFTWFNLSSLHDTYETQVWPRWTSLLSRRRAINNLSNITGYFKATSRCYWRCAFYNREFLLIGSSYCLTQL